MSNVLKLLSFTKSVLGEPLAPLEPQSPATSPRLRLLRQLLKIQSRKKGLKIIQNVLLAALSLASVQDIPLSEIKESTINLPDAAQAMLAKER
jgi:hypothetical protein